MFSLPAPRYTVEDWQAWSGDWELWEGQPVALASPSKAHQLLLRRLANALEAALEQQSRGYDVIMDVDWRVNQETVFRPDISVVCGDDHPGFVARAPRLIVEILSPSTRQNDLLTKKFQFKRYGVAHYLTIDPAERALQRQFGDSSGDTEEKLDLPLLDRCRVTLPRVVQV